MASCSNAPSSKSGLMSMDNSLAPVESTTQSHGSPTRHEEDEDEDEDIDFNPFLKETFSPEASSSLSSEVEGLEDNGTSDVMKNSNVVGDSLCLMEELHRRSLGDSECTKEVTSNHTTISQVEACEEELQRRMTASCETENAVIVREGHATKRDEFDGTFVNEVALTGKPGVLSDDDDDAICKRTRARYSLAGFTLDELESFLQETDDDEDLQNVDDEEEYRKFLARVLLGGDGEDPTAPENRNVDDEDEDNDADFEIELEEALDSDIDDRQTNTQRSPSGRSRRKPETRQNGRQNSCSRNKNKLLEQGKRTLRPVLPFLPAGPNALVATVNGQSSSIDDTSGCPVLVADNAHISGFTPYQIGQLYCLIHEHVQLLVQIYSLCVLDPSRQQISSQVQELIREILHKRDQILAWRSVPYPRDLFRAPYLISSVSSSPWIYQDQYVMEPSMNNVGVGSATDCMEAKGDACLSSRQSNHTSSGPMGPQTFEGFHWVPVVDGPILSILDVAPLDLVENYMADMSVAIQENRRRHVEFSYDFRAEREPLFPLPSLSVPEVNGDSTGREFPKDANRMSSSSSQPLKKSLAATLVETTKTQSIALVPKEVAKLAQKFIPLFNQALFPHKPPPASVTNRALFTDAEDELLALGMMEYNTDWKAIQERFLPCKSKHQIFVRQKNRCSSKAPENPIKAVRRMKTSSLTMEEVRCIQKGLKLYKLDWMSVWKFTVPHRDPSLLPRQWRTAMGTQKSYKQNPANKQKRRIYEAERRRRKATDSANWSHGSEKEDCGSGDDCVDDPDEAYVHEAFLADWRPGTSGHMPAQPEGTHSTELLNTQMAVGGTNHAGYIHQYITRPNNLVHTLSASHSSANQAGNTNPMLGRERLVKLAPNLPPVNLPRNVRILSESAYRTHQHVARVGSIRETRLAQGSDSHKDVSGGVGQRTVGIGEERFYSSGLQMHPLLFQVPAGGHLPYYLANCSIKNPGSFSFVPGNQPQLNLSPFRSPNQMIQDPTSLKSNMTQEVSSTLPGIEFHPLLQRFDGIDCNSQSSVHPSTLEKANDLDLDIHLSSTSRKVKDLKSKDNANLRGTLVRGENSGSSHLPLESLPSIGGLIETGSEGLTNNDVDQSYVGSMGDQSHHEIVMEQEELSDSEEEFEQQVEFECEEMTDSEEEDVSGAETFAKASSKDTVNLHVEKVSVTPQSGRYQTIEKHYGPDVSSAGKSGSPSVNSGLISEPPPRDKKPGKSWLSLLPSPGESPAANISAPSLSNRSSRKTKEPARTEVNSPTMPQIRGPRKRPCRNNN